MKQANEKKKDEVDYETTTYRDDKKNKEKQKRYMINSRLHTHTHKKQKLFCSKPIPM